MNIYCPEPLNTQPVHPLFYFKYAPEKKVEGLFKEHIPENFFQKEPTYVASGAGAGMIVLPNNFLSLTEAEKIYIRRYADLGETLHVPVYAFSCGDHTDTLMFDKRVRVFRYSLYRSSMQERDICTPTLTEDIGREGISLRAKNNVPVVSFCGKGGFGTRKEYWAGHVKRLAYELWSVASPLKKARIRGVFWRMWGMKACSRSSLVKTLFIVRKTFSGTQKTIELDPAQAREEFIGSVRDADFVLAPKGDGNYSNRFLEALSMGRFPVVPDTDCVFPFEDRIDYTKIVVKVPMKELKNIPKYIRSFYDPLSPEEYATRQRLAREIFEKYLRQDAFFREYFSA